MATLKPGLVQLSGQIYAIDQQMVRSFVIVGKQAALCIDAGVVPADFAGMISSVTRFPAACCLTHTDGDHTANLHAFSRVYIHPSERPLLTPDRYSDGTEIVRVSERDCFDLGGIQLKVVACSGHTPGSIALLDEEHGILFSGDTISYGPVYLFGAHRNLDDYIESLHKLQGMAAEGKFDTIYPSHNTCPVPASIISI